MKVVTAVDRVAEAVQPRAVAHVPAGAFHLEPGLSRQTLELEPALGSARSIEGPMNSTNVLAPGSEHLKVTAVADTKFSIPVVRSSRTS